MELLCIAIKDDLNNVDKILEKQLNLFKEENLNINKQANKIGNVTFLKYEVDDEKTTKYNNIKNIFKHYVANAISDIIIDIYQEKIISRMINDRCYFFSETDKSKVRHKTIDFLSKNEFITAEGIMYKISKKARILKSVIEYLESNNEINIEGFVNFRLRFFIETIEDAIDKNVEDFIVEKEYREFIKILQYFVDIQEPKIDLVNVLIKKDKYELYDEDKKFINNDFLEEIADELTENNINYDDLLISSLITIAPRKIVLHLPNNDEKEIIQIIESVFADKVHICNDCEFCNLNSDLQNVVKREK